MVDVSTVYGGDYCVKSKKLEYSLSCKYVPVLM